MHTTRDKALHDRRRRVWAPAFSDKALREYETTVQELNEKLISRVGEFEGKPVDVTTWFNLYSFDVMGRLAFGKDYHMVENGKRHWALDLLTEGMAISGLRLPTWVFRILLSIPGLAAGYYKFLKFCSDELKWRVENGGKGSGKDITGWLLKAYGNDKHPDQDPMLQGDARLIIVAGSDTTSATLTYLFYHLAQDPTQVKRLRDELRPLTIGDWSDKDIQHAEHLNGAINETLRLHPPVPSGLFRQTPPEGLRVGEVYIPGGVTFFTPQYAMGRDEDIYADATSFVPERWYSKPDMIKHADAFAPFSQGPFNCIGRNRESSGFSKAASISHDKLTSCSCSHGAADPHSAAFVEVRHLLCARRGRNETSYEDKRPLYSVAGSAGPSPNSCLDLMGSGAQNALDGSRC